MSSDPRVQQWFFLGSPLPIVSIIVAYLYIVLVAGPKFMENRNPHSLKKIIAAYNIFQLFANSFIIYGMLTSGWANHLDFGGSATFPMILNAIVHVLMYTYYLLTLMGPRMQRRLNKVKRYLTIIQMANPRVKNWPLIGSPVYLLVIIALYLFCVLVAGPKFMENRRPYNLKKIIAAYNIFQVVANSYAFYGMFFVLRKKQNQVSFLHVYHHISTIGIGYLGSKYLPGGMVTFPIMPNTLVHVLMYTYYLLALQGPDMQKKLAKFKKYLTAIQMVTFKTTNQISKVIIYAFNPRVKNWPLIGSPVYLLVIIALYLFFVLVAGPKFMENRRPYNLKKIIAAYNIFQVVANAYLFYGLAGMVWKIYILKIVDLLDTIFFVLRKKSNQVTFLHMYHHVSTIALSLLGAKYFPGGSATFPILPNTLVHILMYTYYLLALQGPDMQKKLARFKRYLTTIQLIPVSKIGHSLVALFTCW
uniref:Elongation of very long chain fatty acids protein n=1 Tax=Timema cristinae TaxID=61476 RepID=A0A7R9CPE3_TIMCR|nr:unnamed protein product [Timema cristinae]